LPLLLLLHELCLEFLKVAGVAEIIDKSTDLREAFKSWVTTTGTNLVTDPEKDATLIQALIDLNTMLDQVVKGPFKGSPAFIKVCVPGHENCCFCWILCWGSRPSK
jgi:hypothetical protein